MDLRQLRYFVAVARERNFTRAAETLHIAQPPLSRQIQLLEAELGVTLISRAPRPLRLTDAGRLFNEQAMKIIGRGEPLTVAHQRQTRQDRNFTRAAETLHIAQPPLSRQIQLLEEELGVTLISRATRPLRLTDAGRLFNEQAMQILGRVEQLKVATQRVGRQERRVLSIGFVASTLYSGVPSLVRELRKHAPELDIQLLEMMSSQQIEALKTGRIDIGFGRIRRNDPAVERTVLREERLVLAIAPGSRLAGTDAPLAIEALARERSHV